MQHQAAPGYLQIERKFRLEAVFPVDGHAEVGDVKLLGLASIEHAKDWDDAVELHCVSVLSRRAVALRQAGCGSDEALSSGSVRLTRPTGSRPHELFEVP